MDQANFGVVYEHHSSVALTRRRGPRVEGAFGLSKERFAALADTSGWSC